MTKAIIKWSILVFGATAMASQIIFLQEFLIVYKGNELSIGLVLANWLIWGAFGSFICGRFVDSIRYKVNILAITQFLLALFLLISFLLIRLSGSFPSGVTGEIIGYPRIFLNTFVLLSIPCAILGFLFSLACGIYKSFERDSSSAVTSVYTIEALGSLFGGLFAGYLLVNILPVFAIFTGIIVVNVVSAGVIQVINPEKFRQKNLIRSSLVFLAAVFVIFLSAGGGKYLDQISIKQLWKDFTVIKTDNSIYGNVTLTKRGEQLSFYENGNYLYSIPDKLSSEEAVHYNLLQNKDPERILLIGGGIGGSLEEILKYQIQSVDYVELDPLLIDMAEKYLDDKNRKILNDKRVNIINQDGRYFVKRTKYKYDSIIINVGDPYNAQVNRFYTVECFREISKILKKDGILSFTLTSSENYISDEAREYLNSIYYSAKEVFPDILVIPGDTAIFLMSKHPGILTSDPNELIKIKNERHIDNLFVEDYYMTDKLSEERLRYAEDMITKGRAARLNTDFRPISYYFSIKYWSTQLNPSLFSRTFSAIKPNFIWVSLVLFSLLIFSVYYNNRRNTSIYPFVTAVMTTGFSEIILQLIVIVAFQVIYGFVYYKIAIIFTSFMAGVAAGGWLYSKTSFSIKDKKQFFKRIQMIITFYPIVLPLIFIFFRSGDNNLKSWLGSNLILPFLPFISGLIGGIQFPLANDICLSIKKTENSNIGRISGINYGMDLLGASIGALIAATILIPILGIIQTCILIASLNLVIFLLLTLDRKYFNQII